MPKLLIGFVFRILFTAGVTFFLGPFYPRLSPDPFDHGRFYEDVDIGHRIPEALGSDVDPNEPIEAFLPGKERGVVIVTRRGVKTLRLCCDGSEPKPTP
jgi:hypothetical protein